MLESAEIGKRIKEKREEKSLSLRTIAEKAGVTPSAIGLVEKAKRRPSAELLVGIAAALEVSSEYLLYGPRKKA